MARRKRKTTRKVVPSRAAQWLSPARKRELLGSGLVVVGVVTLVGFVGEPGAITWRWIAVLRWAFGWGAILVPLLLGSLGAWLVVDAVEGEGQSLPGRPVAAGVSFVALLGLAHLVVAARGDVSGGRALAEAQMAGGWLGYGVSTAAAALLGTVAAGVVLGATAVVALAAATGVTLGELGRETLRLSRGVIAAAPKVLARAVENDSAAAPRPAVAEAVESPEETEVSSAAVDAAPAAAGGLEADAAEAAPGATAVRSVAKAAPARWRLPDVSRVLEPAPAAIKGPDDAEAKARLIEDTFAEFGVEVRVVEINRGPTITQFGVEPGFVERAGRRSRVKVSRIVGLQNDLALALAASPIRIQAPVPGRPFVGIEVPNASSAVVTLRGVLESDSFRKVAARGMLPVALGRDTSGAAVAADLAAMPHLLIAGATGSGKSVALNAIVSTLLVTHTPDTLKLLLVDPKRVEMAPFRGLPHLAAPVVVEVERVVGVLQWVVREMDRRYRQFASRGARHVAAYNREAVALGEEPLPYLVLIVDELADLMMVAPEEVERLVTRLAQLARATGIHIIIATQRPSVDVVTGLIKANFPSRIAFAVASSTDSRVILDGSGAEKLLGRGDMLYQASDSSKTVRLQGCYVSEKEIRRITRFWQRAVPDDEDTARAVEEMGVPQPLIQAELWEDMMKTGDPAPDPMWTDALAVLRTHGSASTSFLQRKLRIGYSRAARLMDALEEAGYVGAAQGNQPREVLVEFDDQGHIVPGPPPGEAGAPEQAPAPADS